MFRFLLLSLLVGASVAQQQVTVPAEGSVVINSLGYPNNNYPDDHEESWTITGPEGSVLQFDTIAFQTERGYDQVTVVDSGFILFTFSGDSGPTNARTNTNQVTVTFTTDGSVNQAGFSLSVRAAVGSPVPQIVVPATGSVAFQSQGYPSQYPDNHRELWIVTGPEGSSLQFDAVEFSTESGFDVLTINEDGATIHQFSGSSGPRDARTSSNRVSLSFTSDSSVTSRGFNITVRVAKCPLGVGTCPNQDDICLENSKWCDGHPDCPGGVDEQCPDLSDCGKPTIQPVLEAPGRIVGGVEAVPHSWPWQVALQQPSGFQFCGGSLIAPQWVLTAAHCTIGDSPRDVNVRVGAHNLRSNNEGSEVIESAAIFNHPSYTTRPATNYDVALIKLARPVRASPNIGTVCLPNADDVGETPGTNAYITGWGTLSSGGASTSVLQQTRVRISEQGFCNNAYGGVIRPEMICAAESGRDTCQGDSGGPMVVRDDATGAWRIVGVTSWGRGCALPTHPGVYARPSVFLDWIVQTISQN